MKSILKDREIPYEMLEGVAFAHPNLQYIEDTGIIINKQCNKQTVPIISGGGSGHEPAHFGYVGNGMLAASVSGPLFVPPTYKEILQAIHSVPTENGVFLIVKNFEADMKEFYRAIELARNEGITVKYIVTHDDISVDTYNYQKRHRGVAGTVLVHKILGAAAMEGATIEELEALGLVLTTKIVTLGVALESARIEGYPEYSFPLEKDEVSFGIGIHGELGYRNEKVDSSERLAIELVNKLKAFSKWQEGDEYILLINGLGSMPLMEQYMFTNDIRRLMQLEGLVIKFCKVGNYMTSYNMDGISLTACPVVDPKWLEYLNAPTTAFAW
ncbi:dihydroxyacetone kinase [Granulicatella balaenopterae]|uniref:DhaKLM operon coactivator DhaQ n=2 Tax=Granulicatella balaenopterae TaxID=137733 RepID=A0A1H9N4I8_9LACT|nr:DhaKLM operon coactivator DhaQ [Granulicatella balaenopterae]SER30697.1 dihydroxyacetone kinase [Granulicatella balaenopterae]